jgi:hypothetical protein
MTITPKQRLDAYTYAYLCLLAGFDENGKDIHGYPKQYICDYLSEWTNIQFPKCIGCDATYFPEWYAQLPKNKPESAGLGWWNQKSPQRKKALERAIAECEIINR